MGARSTDPIVIVEVVHVPLGPVVSVGLLAAGVALLVVAVPRYRRTGSRPWLVLGVAAALIAALSVAALVVLAVRSGL